MQSLDRNEFLTRQSDIISNAELKAYPITIIGAGAIGGWVALSLVKMGIHDITVWDHDTVDVANMNCQFYRVNDIGRPKVEALSDLIQDFCGVTIKVHNKKYTDESIVGICISAVDNMKTRKDIYTNSPMASYIVDPRMGSEDALMYIIKPNDPSDRSSYNNVLYSDENAVQERCTSKATIYTANLLAGHVVKGVKDIITNSRYPRITNWCVKTSHLITYYNKER